jgi:two-component system sensor kinase
MAESKLSEAAVVFQRGFEIARKGGIKNTYVIPCLPWLATALRSEAERIRDSDAAENKRLLRKARTAARRGLRLARKFQNDLPHALRENGLVLTRQGRHRKARRFFEKSLAVAERQGARYEQAQTRLAVAHLALELDEPGATEEVAAAEETLREMEDIDALRT